MIGNSIKSILFFLNFKLVYFVILTKEMIKGQQKEIYVFDLDNTLANTWPSLCVSFFPSESYRYKSLSVFINMRKLILKLSKDKTILFLSSRSILVYPETLHWLKGMELNVGFSNLILVHHPQGKVSILKHLAMKYRVKYIDDLSYGQENGVVKYYSDIISDVKKMKVIYFGYDVINRINNWRVAK